MARQLAHDIMLWTWRLIEPALEEYDVAMTAVALVGALSAALAIASAVGGYRLGARRAAARLAPPPDPLPHDTPVRVVRVVDGDTFVGELAGGQHVRVRVLGLDTPESKRNDKAKRDASREGTSVTTQITLGSAAHDAAKELLSRKRVRLEAKKAGSPLKKDKYGRYLAYVRLPNGRDFGEEIIRRGYGECYGWAIAHPRQEKYEKVRPTTAKLRKLRDRIVRRAKKDDSAKKKSTSRAKKKKK